ncbi:MAG: type 4a pilus biogenesis protein PilO [Actinomycetota bacterium]|nr:type 4a pilus biogenesis protein PilO [Actinomycetota bacterium]
MRIKVSPGIWLVVGVVICVVILVLGLFLIVFPQRDNVSEVQADIDDAETSIQQERNKLNQLKQYEKDPQQFTRQIEALSEHIPETVELADIIQQVDHAAEEAGLDFYSFIPSLPVSSGSYYTVTCEGIFHGRYFNLVEFFNQVERLPRTVKVVYLDLIESDAGLPYLQIKINFRCFFTVEQGVELLLQSGG